MADAPIVPTLPQAPQRLQAAPNYAVTADVWAAAIGPWTVVLNNVTLWINDKSVEISGYATSAANSATLAAAQVTLAAAQVTLAANQVTLATNQVALATAQAGNAANSAATATAMAQAAGASAGVPVPVALRALITNASGVASWSGYLVPAPTGQGGKAIVATVNGLGYELKAIGQAPGDILITSRAVDDTYILANGATRLQADYPDLYLALGANGVTPPSLALVLSSTFATSYVRFSYGATYLAYINNTSLSIYKRTADSLATPQSLSLPTSGTRPTFTPDNVYVTVGLQASPYLYLAKRTVDTFAVVTPAIVTGAAPTSAVNKALYSPDGVYLAIACQASPFIMLYKNAGSTGQFTQLTGPSSLPGIACSAMAWSPDGVYLAIATNNNDGVFLHIYKRSGDILTKLANPAALPQSLISGIEFTPDGLNLGFTCVNTSFTGMTYFGMYNRSGDTFTATTATIASVISSPSDMAWSPDGQYLTVCGSASIVNFKKSGNTLTQENGLTPATGATINGLSYANGGSTYLGTYLAFSGSSGQGWYRDAYPINPVAEFKVPSIAAPTGQLAPIDSTTRFRQPQLTAYIKAKAN